MKIKKKSKTEQEDPSKISEACEWFSKWSDKESEDKGEDDELCLRCGERFKPDSRYKGYYCESCQEWYRNHENMKP